MCSVYAQTIIAIIMLLVVNWFKILHMRVVNSRLDLCCSFLGKYEIGFKLQLML